MTTGEDFRDTAERSPRRFLRGTALLMASTLTVVGCSESNSTKSSSTLRTPSVSTLPTITASPETVQQSIPSTTRVPSTTTPNASSSLPETACSFREVNPGRYFNPSNRENIDEQLELLGVLENRNRKVGLRDIKTTTEAAYNVYKDPKYAFAMKIAVEQTEQGDMVTTDEFLGMKDDDTSNKCGPDRQSLEDAREQRQAMAEVGGFLFGNETGALFNQAGNLASRTWDAAQAQFEEWLNSTNTEPNR